MERDSIAAEESSKLVLRKKRAKNDFGNQRSANACVRGMMSMSASVFPELCNIAYVGNLVYFDKMLAKRFNV